MLTHKAPSKICRRQHSIFLLLFFFFQWKQVLTYFMWIICQAEDLHELSRLIFFENRKKIKMSSAAVVIGTLRINRKAADIGSLNIFQSTGKFSRRQTDISYFSQKIDFGISCKLSPQETICLKCQSLFSGKNKKYISKCCLLKFFTQHA